MQRSPRIGYSANYYDGHSAAAQSTWVVPQQDGLSFSVHDVSRHWRYDDITQTQGDNDAEHVRFQTREQLPQALVVPDTDILHRIREIAPYAAGFHNPETRKNRRQRLVGAAVGIVVMSWLIYMYALPVLVGTITALIPVSMEEALGQTVLGHVAPVEKRSEEEIHHRVMQTMTDRLTRERNYPYEFRVHVIKSDVFNAYALPGGHIAFNTALIRRMTRPEQLAAILAHEIQHVVRKHGTRSVLRQMSIRALVAAIGGSEGGIGEVLDWASLAGAMSFSREAEAEADRRGVQMMIRARIDPGGAVEAFEILRNTFGDIPQELSYIASHPLTRDRIAALEPYRDSLKVEPEPIISEADWEAFLAASR